MDEGHDFTYPLWRDRSNRSRVLGSWKVNRKSFDRILRNGRTYKFFSSESLTKIAGVRVLDVPNRWRLHASDLDALKPRYLRGLKNADLVKSMVF